MLRNTLWVKKEDMAMVLTSRGDFTDIEEQRQ